MTRPRSLRTVPPLRRSRGIRPAVAPPSFRALSPGTNLGAMFGIDIDTHCAVPPNPGGTGNYWNGDWFLDAVKCQLSNNLMTSGEGLAAVLQQVVSIQGPPRSKSGQAPRIDKDIFHPSIHAEFSPLDPENLTVLVGSGVEYSLYLEILMNRPWLRNTFASQMGAIKTAAIAGLGTEV